MTIPAESTISKEDGGGTEQEKPTAVQHGTVVESEQVSQDSGIATSEKKSPVAAVEKKLPAKKLRQPDANGKHGGKPAAPGEKKNKSQPSDKTGASSPDDHATKRRSKQPSPADSKVTVESSSKGNSKIDVQATRETGPVASSETFQDVKNDHSKPNAPVESSEPTAVPPAARIDPFAEAPDAMWYVAPPSGGKYGPADAKMMQGWVAEGRVSADSLVWREGWDDWRSAKIVMPETGTPISPTPPAVPAVPAKTGDNPAGGRESDSSQSDASLGLAEQGGKEQNASEQGGREQAANSKSAAGTENSDSENVPSSMRYHRARNKSRTMGIALICGLAIISIGLLVWLVIAVTSGQ